MGRKLDFRPIFLYFCPALCKCNKYEKLRARNFVSAWESDIGSLDAAEPVRGGSKTQGRGMPLPNGMRYVRASSAKQAFDMPLRLGIHPAEVHMGVIHFLQLVMEGLGLREGVGGQGEAVPAQAL